jgi:hypothetical protein
MGATSLIAPAKVPKDNLGQSCWKWQGNPEPVSSDGVTWGQRRSHDHPELGRGGGWLLKVMLRSENLHFFSGTSEG